MFPRPSFLGVKKALFQMAFSLPLLPLEVKSENVMEHTIFGTKFNSAKEHQLLSGERRNAKGTSSQAQEVKWYPDRGVM